MFKALFARFFRDRSEAEREASDQFKAQVKEALLSQASLREAADQMRRIREESEAVSRPAPITPRIYRRPFRSTPTT